MRRFLSVMLGLSLLAGITAPTYAQDDKSGGEEKKERKGKKKRKKKDGDGETKTN